VQIPDPEAEQPPEFQAAASEELPSADPFSSATRVGGLDASALFGDIEGATKVGGGLDPRALFGEAREGATQIGAVDEVVDRHHEATFMGPEPGNSTKVVARPAPLGERTRIAINPGQPVAPLRLDFSEVLPSGNIAGAQRIGGETLAADEFMDKYDREALNRAQEAPDFILPSSIDRDASSAAVRVVEQKGRVWVWALLAILIPTVLSVVGVAIYYQIRRPGSSVDMTKIKQADEAAKKALIDHEKAMAR